MGYLHLERRESFADNIELLRITNPGLYRELQERTRQAVSVEEKATLVTKQETIETKTAEPETVESLCKKLHLINGYDKTLVDEIMSNCISQSSDMRNILSGYNMLEERKQFLLALSVPDLIVAKKMEIVPQNIDFIITEPILDLLVACAPLPPPPPLHGSGGQPFGNPNHPNQETAEDILRYYIRQSSNNFDIEEFILNLILWMLGMPNIPVQTIYLVFVWAQMLTELYEQDRSTSTFKKILKICVALLVSAVQVVNREYKYAKAIKTAYSLSSTGYTMLRDIPHDVKKAICDMYGLPAIPYNDVYIVNFMLGWNKDLEIMADIGNLSMSSAINMVYTYRIGLAYTETKNVYSNFNQSDTLNALLTTICNFGPIPTPKQVFGIIELFRKDEEYYSRKVLGSYGIFRTIISPNINDIIEKGALVYRRIIWINLAYKPDSTYCQNEDGTRTLKFDHPLIYMISGNLKKRNYECLANLTVDELAELITEEVLKQYNEICSPFSFLKP